MGNDSLNQDLIQLSENELNEISGGGFLLIAGCYALGFATGAAILYFSR